MRRWMSGCVGLWAWAPWRPEISWRPEYYPPSESPRTARGLLVPRPAARTAPNPPERRQPSERADAHTAGLGAGALPAPTWGSVRLWRVGHGAPGTARTGHPWLRPAQSTPPVRIVAPFSPSRLPVPYVVKENAR